MPAILCAHCTLRYCGDDEGPQRLYARDWPFLFHQIHPCLGLGSSCTPDNEGQVVSGRPTNQAGGVISGAGGSSNAVNGYYSLEAVNASGG